MNQSRVGFEIGLLFCLLLVLLLQVYPLSGAANVWRPDFVLMLCCYVVFYRSVSTAFWFALLAGLITDIVCGCVLGKHALALTLSIACLAAILPRIRHGWLLHEALAVAVLTLVCGLILQSLNLFSRESVKTAWILYPAITTFFVWPLISWFFSKFILSERVINV